MEWKEVTKEEYEKLYKRDLVTPHGGITFTGKNRRYCDHVHGLRNGQVLGKTVTDLYSIEPTKYFLRR